MKVISTTVSISGSSDDLGDAVQAGRCSENSEEIHDVIDDIDLITVDTISSNLHQPSKLRDIYYNTPRPGYDVRISFAHKYEYEG